jgi:hypothetical protein
MIDFSYLHEIEIVSFRADQRKPLNEILSSFEDQGFALHDDIISLDRKGIIPPWQHSSIVSVEFQLDGEEVFGFEDGEWNIILLKYLFASLPFDLSETFIQVVKEIGEEFKIIPYFHGKETDAQALRKSFLEINSEIMAKTGEAPGSESLAILIQNTYPRH